MLILIVLTQKIDLQKPNDPSNGFVQDIGIAQTIRHPDYRTSQLFNDIALLKLIKPADITDSYVYPVCLNTRNDVPGPDASVEVIGWGETENGN